MKYRIDAETFLHVFDNECKCRRHAKQKQKKMVFNSIRIEIRTWLSCNGLSIHWFFSFQIDVCKWECEACTQNQSWNPRMNKNNDNFCHFPFANGMEATINGFTALLFRAMQQLFAVIFFHFPYFSSFLHPIRCAHNILIHSNRMNGAVMTVSAFHALRNEQIESKMNSAFNTGTKQKNHTKTEEAAAATKMAINGIMLKWPSAK